MLTMEQGCQHDILVMNLCVNEQTAYDEVKFIEWNNSVLMIAVWCHIEGLVDIIYYSIIMPIQPMCGRSMPQIQWDQWIYSAQLKAVYYSVTSCTKKSDVAIFFRSTEVHTGLIVVNLPGIFGNCANITLWNQSLCRSYWHENFLYQVGTFSLNCHC